MTAAALESRLKVALGQEPPGSVFDGVLSDEVFAIAKEAENLQVRPDVSSPCLLSVQCIANNDVIVLRDALETHFRHFATSGILPAIYIYLKTRNSALALECLAYCKFEQNSPNISNSDLALPEEPESKTFYQASEEYPIVSLSGFLRWLSHRSIEDKKHTSSFSRFNDNGKQEKAVLPHWVLEWLIVNDNRNKNIVNEWWPLVIPSLLNLLDTVNVPTKTQAVALVTLLSENYGTRLRNSGLIPAFEKSIEPCLSFLPPLVEVSQTMLIHRSAIDCLSKLSIIIPNSIRTDRLHYIAREGCLKVFFHTQENVELTIYFLETLAGFINGYLKSLTVVHLHGIVKVFNQIMCDPFIDYSPQLIVAACDTMAAALEWAWPRKDQYQYTIALGLAKTNALDTRCFQLLCLSEQEVTALKAYVEKKHNAELEAVN